MAKKKKIKKSTDQLDTSQRVFSENSPEFEAIIRDFAFEKTPPPDYNTPALNTTAPFSPAAAPAASRMIPGLGAAGMVGAGMLIPSQIGIPYGEDALAKISQQESVLGGPPVSSEEIAAMIEEMNAPPSPAPAVELYPAMDEVKTYGVRPANRRGMKSTSSSSRSRNADVDAISRQFAAPPMQRQMRPMNRGTINHLDPDIGDKLMEIMLDGLTGPGSPMRRRSYPKRVIRR